MPVEAVHIDESLLFFNLAYALATEREEVGCKTRDTERPLNRGTFGISHNISSVLQSPKTRSVSIASHQYQVMCLLFGTWDASPGRRDICRIRATSLVKRVDKRRDRVEISPEVLVGASEQAESMGLRVVGWFHSHPHITVLPSHVDLRTAQNMVGRSLLTFWSRQKSLLTTSIEWLTANAGRSICGTHYVVFQCRRLASGPGTDHVFPIFQLFAAGMC